MKIGVVDVGGGLRDIYGLGILDRCMDLGIWFDLCIGVSAGSANVASYLSRQRKRNYPFYTVYPFRKEYMGFGNWLKYRSFLNLDYVYSVLCNTDGENPFDYQAMVDNPAELIIVATEASTAKPVYFTKKDLSLNYYNALKSSSAIPFVCKPYETSGIPCFDGALSDPVPVKKALEEGCDKVVVILTKPKDVPREPGSDLKLAKRVRRKYPEASKAMSERYLTYNAQVEFAKQQEKEGKVLILAPEDLFGMTTLKRDVEAMEKLYQEGYEDAGRIPEFLEN